MVTLIVTWSDYPVDENDFDRGVKAQNYDESYECKNFKEAAALLNSLDMSQYNGHEIINYTIVG